MLCEKCHEERPDYFFKGWPGQTLDVCRWCRRAAVQRWLKEHGKEVEITGISLPEKDGTERFIPIEQIERKGEELRRQCSTPDEAIIIPVEEPTHDLGGEG